SQERMCGGRYLSCDEGLRVFAASAKGPMTLEVRWRSGRVSRLEGVEADSLYEVDEAGAGTMGTTGTTAKPGGPPPAPAEPPLFTDASPLLGHVHEDPPSDEFQLQPLLSRRLGELGPALAWFDLDGDGDDDLVVGSGSGGMPTAFLGDGRGGFTRQTEPVLAAPLPLDTAGLLGLVAGAGDRELVVGVSSVEDPGSQRARAVVRPLTPAGTASVAPASPAVLPESLPLEPGSTSSTGPVAAGSVAGRPGVVLFVGGRAVPGRYPESADSGLWFREGGRWNADPAATAAFRSVGLVGGAVFTDLDGDGSAELVLAREWDTPAIFSWTNGVPVDRTAAWGLAGLTGWWNSVQAGDWDGDGRMDLVLGNWGRNSRWQDHLTVHPARVHYGDADGDGRLELIEAFWHVDSARWLPWRDAETVGRSFPGLAERLPTFRAYGEASVPDLLGDRAASFRVREAASGESVVLLNRGDRFERSPLPVEA
ncbi:MAG: FG-GAP-like repeat-containing protein, partial [Verrucomicrobiota bacterium]